MKNKAVRDTYVREAEALYPKASAEWCAKYAEFRRAGSTPTRAQWQATNALKPQKVAVVEVKAEAEVANAS